MAKDRSPLKAKPLRVPGQSVQDELDGLAWDTIGGYFIISAVLVLLALLEWVAVWNRAPRMPRLYTALAAVALSVSAVKILAALRKAKRLKLGRDGERVVGQFLDGLRAEGARIFHDIPGEGFNLDHVVIAPTGIVVVETKTRTKPTTRAATVTFADRELRIAGARPDRDPIQQAQSGARWLQGLLEHSTGKRFSVRSAVVFPGWFVAPMDEGWKSEPALPWVLEPKALSKFIQNEPISLEMSDVALAAYHLSRYVRAEQDRPN